MNKEGLKKFKALLLQKRKRYNKKVTDFTNASMKNTPGANSAYSDNVGDGGSFTEERHIGFALTERDSKHLKRINAALLRIENGTFGKCRTCKNNISDERLEAVPTGTQCKKCKGGIKGQPPKKKRGR